ncbi:hypothetical protein IAU60_002799 [Kwoniella sp. DSM 27419]
MVRFKNRYLLVEFLVPSAFTSTISATPGTGAPALSPPEDDQVDSDDDIGDDQDEDELLPIPTAPFLLPSGQPPLKLGDDGANVIYKAVRGVIGDVFGDEGWGRIASSFRVLYHSPLTTLTFMRIARPHYRLLWSAVTFLTTLSSTAVIPRVIAVSGTIKKLQNRGVSYHRAMVGGMIAAVVQAQENGGMSVISGAGAGKVEKEGQREREEMARLGDV